MKWFIREDIAQAMLRDRKAGTAPTAAQCATWEAAQIAALAGDTQPRGMVVAGDTMEIRIEGALTMRPSYYAYYYGGGNTTYEDIIKCLALAQADSQIKRVVLRIASPGGNVDGLFETLAALESFTKKMESKASMACSAAYAIASMTSRIEAAHPAACFGSIGVAATYIVWDDEVTITSTEAPDKRPDVRTEAGKAVVRKELDDYHDLFVDAIARGRKTTVARVNAEFGRGATVLSAEAKKLGMVDGISKPAIRVVPTNASADDGGADQEETTMDIKLLKAQHADLFAEVMQLGATTTLAAERDRVNAHLTAGEGSGDMKTALASVRSGEAMTQTLQTQYMMAAANRGAVTARQTETDAAGKVTDGAAPKPGTGAGAEPATEDLGDKIVALRKARTL